MGIFNKWSKQKKDEQLKAAGKSSDTPVSTDAVETKKSAPKKAAAKKSAQKTSQPVLTAGVHAGVLSRTHITEKSAAGESVGVYTFEVSPTANKYTVALAVQERFGVTPEKITIMNRRGKRVRFGYRKGKRKNRKFARVFLKKGEVLSVHKGV